MRPVTLVVFRPLTNLPAVDFRRDLTRDFH
jgi:hypothetical protein